MTVYVDKSIHKYRRMIMCHMIADTVNELHDMASKIGINRKWFQSKASSPHYDICKSKRAQAVELGAIEVDRKGMINIIRRLRDVST